MFVLDQFLAVILVFLAAVFLFAAEEFLVGLLVELAEGGFLDGVLELFGQLAVDFQDDLKPVGLIIIDCRLAEESKLC